MNPKTSAVVKGIAGGYELILAIPFIGGTIVVASGWQALTLGLVIHIVALGIAIGSRTSVIPSVFGIVTSLLAWIPILGWILHTVTCIVYFISAYADARKDRQDSDIIDYRG